MRRRFCVLWALLTMVAGLAVRMAPLGLPWSIAKYGGSALWAVMIYWVLAVAFPRWEPFALGTLSSAVAIAVEFGKLYRSPGMDAFRLTLAGKLLLGRFFAWSDVVAYLAGIWVVAPLETWRIRRRAETRRILKDNPA